MKVDTRFHCFGCGADGDVIDFTARLYGLSPKEAAENQRLVAQRLPVHLVHLQPVSYTHLDVYKRQV